MDISRASSADLGEILEVAKAAFGSEEYEDYVEKEIVAGVDPDSLYSIMFFVCRVDGRIVSYGGLAEAMILTDVFELRLGATLPEFQKRGIMSLLVHARLEEAFRLSQERPCMVVTSTRYPSIYSGHGFHEIFENSRGYKYMIRAVA